MPFDYATAAAGHRVPNLPEAGPHVGYCKSALSRLLPSSEHTAAMSGGDLTDGTAVTFLDDVLGSKKMTGSYFLLENDAPSTPPKYEYDESGVLMKGKLLP